MSSNFKIKPLPYLRIFIAIFLVYNFLGISNFPIYNPKLIIKPLIILVFIGFFGFVFGTLFVRQLHFNIKQNKGVKKNFRIFIFFLITLSFSFAIIIVTHIINGGIIIFMGDKRFTNLPLTNLIIYIGIANTLVYFANGLIENTINKKFILIFIIQSVFILSIGYRAPMIVLIGGATILFFIISNQHQAKVKKIFTFKNVIYFIFGLFIISYIGSYRVSLKYNTRKFFKNINHNYIDEHPVLSPFVSSISAFRYDQQVVGRLIKKTENNHLYGKLLASNAITLLPGSQLGARNIIGQIIDARKIKDGKPWSITPTLQGALFVDGGRVFVFFGFFFLAGFIEYLKKIVMVKKDPFNLTVYALFAMATILLIHTGYYDILIFLFTLVLYIIKFLVYRIKKI